MPTFASEDRLAIRGAVARILADRCSMTDVRATMEIPSGYDPDLWKELARMGVVGLVASEEFGGVAAGPMGVELVMEEVGAALFCGPFLPSAVLSAALLEYLGDGDASEKWLSEIVTGSAISTVAVDGSYDLSGKPGATFAAGEAAGGWRLDGGSPYVLHAQSADIILVPASAPDGLGIYVVEADAPGVSITPLPTFDRTLRLAALKLEGVVAERIRGKSAAGDALGRALNLARVALAGEQAGAARRVLEFTVDYAKARIQFGRPIGSFQAIKHMAADLLLEVESATSAAREAARLLEVNSPAASAAVCLAASACGDAFMKVSADAIQMHGGIAFTWDHDAHLYLRRARADAQLFGTPALHREGYLRALEVSA